MSNATETTCPTEITDAQIEELRAEARQHGDDATIADCDAVLRGSDDAREACLEVIVEAWAS